jgi:hypothetical protein
MSLRPRVGVDRPFAGARLTWRGAQRGTRGAGAGEETAISALTVAVWSGNPTHVASLLDAGENPGRPDDMGSPPWVWATVAGDRPSLKLMLSRIKDIEPAGRAAA